METRSSSCIQIFLDSRFEYFNKANFDFQRFVAKPMTKEDGTINMLKWYCEIPGPEGVRKRNKIQM